MKLTDPPAGGLPGTLADAATIPAAIGYWASHRGQAPAILSEAGPLPYGELYRRARTLASRLADCGVSTDSVVAIRALRSADLLIAMLAAVMAGGAYLAFDGEQPPERLRRMIDDARPAIMLVQESLRAGVPPVRAETRILEDELSSPATPWREAGIHPDDLAYVSYTSGSTGVPKGIAVPHRGVLRLVLQPGWADFTSADVFLQLAPVAFDASTFEIWGALANGAALAVPPPGPVTPELITAAVRQHRVSVLHLTAGLFHQIADTAPEVFGGLRHLLAGGDVVSSRHVASVLAAHPGLTFTHAYGPTENTTFTTCLTLTRPPSPVQPLPIGRPVRGTRVAILDPALHPVPAGAVGEMYVSGDGLARCYLHDPAATSQAFLPDPVSAVPGRRMYRTGDLARRRDDGVIEFLGRADAQVKIRGHRVEPAEIEAALREHPAVHDAVVTIGRAPSGEPEVAAWLTGPRQADLPALRRQLAARLPAAMLPSAVTLVDKFPVTANGKVDRAALARGRPPGPPSGGTAPTDSLEMIIAEAWREVLGTHPGRNQKFFDAGGNSLLLIRLRALLRKRLTGYAITTALLFEHPTVHALADHLRTHPGSQAVARAQGEETAG